MLQFVSPQCLLLAGSSLSHCVSLSLTAPVPKKPTVVEEVKVEPVPPPPTPEKEPAAPAPAANQKSEPVTRQPPEKDHEPHLGPRPRSHNKVLNPPGGKSSVVFY